MAGLSPATIAKREASTIRPKERSADFCSLLTAYRLLDVVSVLERTTNSLAPPVHKKMQADFEKYKVCLCVHSIFEATYYSPQQSLSSLDDWTLICKKFRRNMNVRNTQLNKTVAVDNLPGRHLQVLFDIHCGIAGDKSLFNLQLAATHISFMLNHESNEMV
jgi:hypothetical protein